jgi:hypothetical protein
MKRILFSLSILAAIFLISSCSGLPNGSTCTTGCTGGNANLTLTILDTPPAGANFLNFNLPIIGISLTSATTGATVNVFSPTTIPTIDLVRLQSDSALLGTFQIAPDTYNKMTITLGTPSTIFANTGSTAIGSCAPVMVCSFNGGTVGSVVVTLSPVLTLGASANVGMGIDFTLDNIVTTTNTGDIAFDFTQPNAITPVALPRVGQATGTLDSIEDFMGIITASSGNSLTVVSKTRGTLTGTTSNATTFTGLSSPADTVCGGHPSASCVATGKTVSVDATIGLDGTISITEVDFLDDPSVDEIEGVIYPTGTPGTFGMIVYDAVNASNNSALTNVGSGFVLAFTLDPTATFAVDTRNLGAAVSAGFSSQSDMFAGQQVMIRVQSTNTSGTTFNVVTNRLVLRYSRTSATVSTVGGNAFGIVPPNFFGLNSAPLVQTFSGITAFDNITDISGLTAGDNVSIRALYLNPQTTSPSFLAAKVRKH